MPAHDEPAAEDAPCLCGHQLWEHSGVSLGWPCCSPDCDCRSFVLDRQEDERDA